MANIQVENANLNNKESEYTTKTKFHFGNISPMNNEDLDRDADLEHEIVQMITEVIAEANDPTIIHKGSKEAPFLDSGKTSMNNSAYVTQMELVFEDKFLDHPEPHKKF